MCLNNQTSKGRNFSCLLFLFLLGSFCHAQKEQFIGFNMGVSGHFEESAFSPLGLDFSVFYEQDISKKWTLEANFNFVRGNNFPNALIEGNSFQLRNDEKIKGYFVGKQSELANKSYFYSQNTRVTFYANYFIELNKIQISPGLGAGYGKAARLDFGISKIITNPDFTVSDVDGFNSTYWQKGVLNLSPKVRILYSLNEKVNLSFESKIVFNIYTEKANLSLKPDYDYGNWSNTLGIRFRL